MKRFPGKKLIEAVKSAQWDKFADVIKEWLSEEHTKDKSETPLLDLISSQARLKTELMKDRILELEEVKKRFKELSKDSLQKKDSDRINRIQNKIQDL